MLNGLIFQRCLHLCRQSWPSHMNTQMIRPTTLVTISLLRDVHTSRTLLHRDGTLEEIKAEKSRKRKEVVLFKEIAAFRKAKDKETFMKAINIYEKKQSVYRRGHVDFILGALEQMEEYQVHKDVEVYKALMGVFPVGEMVPSNIIQYEFMHYPRQQNTAIDILSAMANHGCIPDDEMGSMIIDRFGKHSYVMKKYQRTMYWGPKFKAMNPYPVPWVLPNSKTELAVLALKRMAVDKNNRVEVCYTSDESDGSEGGFIASACSPEQRELMMKHKPQLPLYVEGGFTVWLRDQSLVYFILRADPRPEILEYNKRPEEEDDITTGFYTYFGADDEEKRNKTALLADPSIHEQPEGTILSMCITETSSKESLVAWINFLQEENPCLSKVPILFSLRTPESGVQPADYNEDKREELGSGTT